MSAEDVERLRLLIQEEIDNLQSQLAVVQPPVMDPTMPPNMVMDGELAGLEEDKPFFAQLWFWGILGAIGIAGVGFWLFTRMGEGGDEEEDEEDEEMVDDDDEDLDIEVDEEEDDIVVEETS